MTALTLAGVPIDWANPPPANTKVMWSRRTTSGRPVYGTLRAIAWLDHVNDLSMKRFGRGVDVIQSAFNTGVAASEGTHDFAECYDVRIAGVPWLDQQAFFRANGAGAYARVAGWTTPHIHLFVLPPVSAGTVSLRFRNAGIKVGKYVDGGWSVYGRVVGSSQISDYYLHRNALSNHAIDPTWFPANIDATIFNYPAYAKRQRRLAQKTAPIKRLPMTLINIPNKVGAANVRKCITLAMNKGKVVSVNESFHRRQRDIYAEVAKAKGFSYYGLRLTPNPVFWKSRDFVRQRSKVYRLHGRNTTAKNAAKWPGFYDKRELTEVVLKPRNGGREVAVLNLHMLYDAKVLDREWVEESRKQSLKTIRALTRKHIKAGRVVEVNGDTNMLANFSMPKTFRWYTKAGKIDKAGANRPGKASEFAAPTDHKTGVRVVINL